MLLKGSIDPPVPRAARCYGILKVTCLYSVEEECQGSLNEAEVVVSNQ